REALARQRPAATPAAGAAGPAEEGGRGGRRRHGAPEPADAAVRKVAQRSRAAGGVRIGGIDDVLVRYARCCSPVPGDQIVGFITRGRGVTVHTRACTKGLETDPERRVEVNWDVHGELKRAVNRRVR